MAGILNKISYFYNPLKSLANSMIEIDREFEKVVNKGPEQYQDSDFIKQLALKILLKNCLKASIETVFNKTNIKDSDEAIDYLIENYPDSYNIWSINTNFNIESTTQSCIQVYKARYGEMADSNLKSDLNRIYPFLSKQYIA